jgi:hypothetical protein
MYSYENKSENSMEKIKCNNHKIKKGDIFKYSRSKIVTNYSVKEEITEKIKM